MNQPHLIPIESITELIRIIRGKRIILDADLAMIYQVSTKRLNEQYRRNKERFPKDFSFRLTAQEATASRSQIATLKRGRGSNIKYLPRAFTEHGALMADTILNSPRAVAMSVYVIRAFVKMREDQATNAAILKRLAEIDKSLLTHDTALRDIYQKLLPLLSPPPDPPRRKIGFHSRRNFT